MAATSWSDVSNIPSCAHLTIGSCPASRGFVYASGTGQCQPLLWLYQGTGVASGSMPAGELFLKTGVCPQGFQAVDYGDAGHLTACVAIIAPSTTYDDATDQCIALGGHLASVKSTDKLDLVVTLAQGVNLWVGMDDQETEGQYVWQEDGQLLTNDQKDSLFVPGEPNNGWNVEHCVHYRGTHGLLNDQHCWDKMKALCETSSQIASC